MYSDHTLGSGGRSRDLAHGQRRRVRREDRVRRGDPLQLGEKLALDAEVLESGLDHDLERGKVGELGDECQATEGLVFLLLGQPALLDAAREVVVDPSASSLAELR